LLGRRRVDGDVNALVPDAPSAKAGSDRHLLRRRRFTNRRRVGGDATYTAQPLGEARVVSSTGGTGRGLGYLEGTNPKDPLVAPINSPETLARFPPTLIITGTRGFELSAALYTHTQLVKRGVEAELHVWEGLFHGFFYNPDVPESKDAYDVMVKFFDRHLGKK